MGPSVRPQSLRTRPVGHSIREKDTSASVAPADRLSVPGSADDGASGQNRAARAFFVLQSHSKGVFVSKLMPVVLLAALMTITLASPVSAQKRSTADAAVLDAAVAARPDRNRAVVTSALTSSDGLAAAARMGLSPDALSARIAALDDASAQKVADQILAGGDDRIIISTTAVIIGLLILILLTR